MINTKFTQSIAFVLLGVLWIYTFYVSVVSPPFFSYFTVDENYIADSGVFLWYGITPRCLDWPASPSLFVFFLMFGVDIISSIVANIGSFKAIVDVFQTFDYEAYQYLIDRQTYLLVGRSIQLVIVGLILALTIRFIFRQKHPLLVPVVQAALSILIATSYILWSNAPVLRPEAVSGSIFLFIFVRLVFTEAISTPKAQLWAALFALVVAERLLFLFVSPIFFVGVFYLITGPDRWRKMLLITSTFIVVFMAVCPFLLTDPLVLAKSFVGGILAKMNDKPMESFFNQDYISNYFENPASYITLLVCVIGGAVLIQQKRVSYWVYIINWLLFMVMVLRSPKIYDTHVLPAAIIALVVSSLGILFLYNYARKAGSGVAALLILLLAVSNIYGYYQFQQRTHQLQNLHSAYAWIQTLPSDTRLLVIPEMGFYLDKTKGVLERELEQNRDTLKMVKKLNFLLGNSDADSLGDTKLSMAAKSFAFEDEKLYDIQYQLLLRYNHLNQERKYDFDIYLDAIELASGSVKWEEAVQDFRQGKYKYLITERTLDGVEPVQEFTGAGGIPLRAYKAY